MPDIDPRWLRIAEEIMEYEGDGTYANSKEYIAQRLWEARDNALAEMSQPQDQSTCPKGHPRWALTTEQYDYGDDTVDSGTGKPPTVSVWKCSICAEIEAERSRVVEECCEAVRRCGDYYWPKDATKWMESPQYVMDTLRGIIKRQSKS